MKQGKFWEMHHTLFEHQGALSPRDIEKYAREIGVDFAKWHADWESEAIADRVSRDRKQGDVITVSGTPAVYINGREFDLTKFDLNEDLEDWIALEIELGAFPEGTIPSATPKAKAAPAPPKASVGPGDASRSPDKKQP